VTIGNTWYRLTRNAYRAYVHPHARVVDIARAAGLEPVGPPTPVGMWRLFVFERPIRIAEAG
jgi:hypothetical protein